MESGSILVFVISIISVTVANIHNDVIVAVGNKIELLANGSKNYQVELPQYNASTLVALAYDPGLKQLFFSDKRNKKGHIFSIGFNNTTSFGSVHDLVERGHNESVEGLIFDPIDSTLLWTDGLKQSIRRIKLENDYVSVKESNAVEVLHLLEGDRPRGLASDPCTKMIYWTNWNMDRPTIERSFLDGTRRKIIVQNDLKMPHGLGLDMKRQMIYWANNLRFGSFAIERSRVDGSERQRIYEGKGQFIFGLTVGDDYVYWTDWDHKTLFCLPKDGSPDGPVALRKYEHKPMGVIVLKREPIACPALPRSHDLDPEEQFDQNVTIQSETISPESAPLPERLCAGYCFNNGECLTVDSDITCTCSPPFVGDRCELIEKNDPVNNTASLIGSCSNVAPSSDAFGQGAYVTVVCLALLCATSLIAVIYLSVRVWQLSNSRSRRKRRVLVQDKSFRSNDRVINIEDCCNMNICETPCTEPPSDTTRLFASKPSDKVKLLKCEF